ESGSLLPDMPQPVPVGIPSAVLERRADIRAAERRVAAAFNRTKEAQTATLPALSLNGTFSGSTPHLNEFTDPTNMIWSLASNALFPIFNAGKLDADIDIRMAEQKAALVNYQQTALNTFLGVETALSNETLFRERQKHLDEAYANSKA